MDSDRLGEIKKRLAENAYFLNPHTDVNVRDDIQFLLEMIARLEKKTNVLGQQVVELTTEIENVKSDFGGNR